MIMTDKKPKLRKRDLQKERQRLINLLYYYVKDDEKDLIIQRQISFIDNELRILAEMKKK